MTDVILDAGIVAVACEKGLVNGPVSNLLDKACKEGWKIWIYVGQISEILQLLNNRNDTNKNSNEYNNVQYLYSNINHVSLILLDQTLIEQYSKVKNFHFCILK